MKKTHVHEDKDCWLAGCEVEETEQQYQKLTAAVGDLDTTVNLASLFGALMTVTCRVFAIASVAASDDDDVVKAHLQGIAAQFVTQCLSDVDECRAWTEKHGLSVVTDRKVTKH